MHSFEHSSEQISNNTERARAIACDLELIDKTINPNDLRFTHIREKLSEQGLFELEILRVKHLFREELGTFGTEMGDDVWEMLTILELFDPETARHCVDTYHIAKSKVEEKLFNGVVLADWFLHEGVDTKTFFVSCLLHDIGKIEVPHSIVVNKVSDTDCAKLLYENKDGILISSLKKYLKNDSYVLPESIISDQTLLSYLHDELHVRPQMIAPVRLLLGEMSEHAQDEIERQLFHCERTLDDALIKVMRTHDEYSKKILLSFGRKIEAILASAHHKSTETGYTISVGTLHVSVDLAHIIHLADVENAIISMRHYKSGQTPLEALKILAIHATQGAVDSYISYLWIADELYKNENILKQKSEADKANYNSIVDFLNEQKSTHPTYPDWKIIN